MKEAYWLPEELPAHPLDAAPFPIYPLSLLTQPQGKGRGFRRTERRDTEREKERV